MATSNFKVKARLMQALLACLFSLLLAAPPVPTHATPQAQPACVNAPVEGPIATKRAMYDVLGCPVGPQTAVEGGWFQAFAGGSVYLQHGAPEAFVVWGAIRDTWGALGWERGVLGWPVSDERVTPDGAGRYNFFRGGAIYWHPNTGAHAVWGDILARWATLGYDRSWLGYPTSSEMSAADNVGRITYFQNNSKIYWSPLRGAIEFQSPFALPPAIIQQAIINLYPRNAKKNDNDDRMRAYEFNTQGSNYRLYQPVVTPRGNKMMVSFTLDHIRGQAKDDHMICSLTFVESGKLETVNCRPNIAGAPRAPITITEKDVALLATIEPKAAVIAQVSEMSLRMASELRANIEELSDHGGRENLVNITDHIVNEIAAVMWGPNVSRGYVLREGNDQGRCTQDVAGQRIMSNAWGESTWLENDEARSVEIYNLPVGAAITLYDSPKRSRGDDYTIIRILKATPYHCIGSIGSSWNDGVVDVQHFHKNGIAGKVSVVDYQAP